MALFVWLSSVLLALLLAWKLPPFLLWYVRACRAMQRFPNIPGHWFWGNLNVLKPDEKTLTGLSGYCLTNGYTVTGGWLGPLNPFVVVWHPEPLRELLKTPKDHLTYNLLRPWLGDGLLVSEGPKWARNRRLLTPAFHFEILKPYMAIYNSCIQVLLGKWSALAIRSEPVKLFDTISLLSLDIVLQCAFSYKSDCQNVSVSHPYIKYVYELSDHIALRFLNPIYFIDWIFFLTPAGWKMRKACKFLHKHSEKVIQERRMALGQQIASGDRQTSEGVATKRKCLDFLDILLTAVDEDGVGLTDLEIRDEVDTFMFEGHDTTTSGMSWTLYCLAKHPEHQDKVREEVRSVLRGREWLEYDDLKDLKYTQCCIKEAMRLYPPVLLIFRETSKDIKIVGQDVPKGVQVVIPTYAIHRNPEIWKNPSEYNPLRFHPDHAENRHPYAYIPFSAGQRNCIGQNFALNEEKAVIASVVSRFSLSIDRDQTVEMVPKVVLRTRNDIRLKVQPLQ